MGGRLAGMVNNFRAMTRTQLIEHMSRELGYQSSLRDVVVFGDKYRFEILAYELVSGATTTQNKRLIGKAKVDLNNNTMTVEKA